VETARHQARKVVAVALANKLARIGWALMVRQEDSAPAAAPKRSTFDRTEGFEGEHA